MFIADDELREVYKTSASEHLQKIEAGLLHLEKHPDDAERLEEVLRSAHSLKGDSRMLGVKDVETVAHQIEHVLGKLKEDQNALQGDTSDRLYRALDALSKLVSEAVTGVPSGVNTLLVLAQLMGAQPQKTTLPQPEETSSTEKTTLPPERVTTSKPKIALPPEQVTTSKQKTTPQQQGPKVASPTQHSQPERVIQNYRIESVRVRTRDLDALMTQAGELTVTKIRIGTHLEQIEEIVTLWEEWSRQINANRFAVDGAVGGAVRDNFQQENEEYLESLGSLANQLRKRVSEDVARLEAIASELDSGIRTLRLLPLSTIFHLFTRVVRDLSRQQGKQVELVIEGGDTKADKRILEEMKDPLMHMIRNSVDHGIETPAERLKQGKPPTATIRLRGYQTGNSIIIEIVDDGRGLDLEGIKQTALRRGNWSQAELDAMTPKQIQSLIFASGFSTRKTVTEISGRGVGLDVVRANIEKLKGSIEVESTPGKGCSFWIALSTSLATTPVLIVGVDGRPYALPVEFVETTLLIEEYEIFTIEGRDTYAIDGEPVSLVKLTDLLELGKGSSGREKEEDEQMSCIIIKVGQERLGLLVDDLLDEQDAILKPQSKLLKRVRNVTGATILSTGEVCIILNPQDLLLSVQKQTAPIRKASVPVAVVEEKKSKLAILVADDSIAIRTQEKRILEAAGYEVVTAVDGLDAYNKLRTRDFDAVVSDVQMPNLDGLSLAARIRQHREYNELPIVLVTSLASDEDKRRGAEAGANAYIPKGTFSQEELVETLRRLV
ncbi:MAG: response regulator [Hormoscilla sp.]